MLAACSSPEDNGSQDVGPVASVEDAAVAKADEETPTIEEVVATIEASISRAESTTGSGAPALWTLKDEDTKVYLFGTVHLLRPETQWRTETINAAFTSADKLVLEADTDSPEAIATMGRLLGELGVFSDGTKLNDVIDDADEPIVEAALQSIGYSLVLMQQLKPWMVSLQLSIGQITEAGYDPESGVETILTGEAKAAGKRFGYLETAEDQFNIIAGGDIEDQVEGLLFASKTAEFGTTLLDVLVDEWADGDLAGLGEVVANPEAIGGQEMYDQLLVGRNRNWVPQIKAMLEEPGTVFVAVGSAHLAGPDSVVKMLRDEGVEVSGPA